MTITSSLRVFQISYDGHSEQKSWHQHYGCAWAPAEAQVGGQERELICLKSEFQTWILGVSRCWSHLSYKAQEETYNQCMLKE